LIQKLNKVYQNLTTLVQNRHTLIQKLNRAIQKLYVIVQNLHTTNIQNLSIGEYF